MPVNMNRAATKRWITLVAAAVLAVPLIGVVSGGAAAAAPGPFTCSGTQASPGTLGAGTYTEVTVNGACQVNAGQAVVEGTVTVSAGSALLAAFAVNDQTHSGTSGLTAGSIVAESGSTVVLGCESVFFSCIDDPNQNNPTLAGAEDIIGGITANAPLGMLVHNTRIGTDVTETGGGGGANCIPTGPFAAFMSPAYSDFEDNTIGGSLTMSGISSCWLGALRNQIGGNVTMSNDTMADPDAMEVLTNTVAGNVVCYGNSPANQFGDSHGQSNTVSGAAVGECGFNALTPNPAPEPPKPANPGPPPMPATPAMPGGPPTPISVPGAGPGYTLFAADGEVFTFGTTSYGAAPGRTIVAGAETPGGGGYCITSSAGRVSDFGPQGQSCTTLPASGGQQVVGLSASPSGDGYYAVTSNGAVLSSGSATNYGSASNVNLSQPIVGIAASPLGNGYYLVARDGGVLTYGTGALFQGSTGNVRLAQPIVGMAVDAMTGGYWLVAADGGVFSFNAPFMGSLGATHLNAPIVGMVAAPGGDGYYLVAADGGVFTFGPGAHYHGSNGGSHHSSRIVSMGLG